MAQNTKLTKLKELKLKFQKQQIVAAAASPVFSRSPSPAANPEVPCVTANDTHDANPKQELANRSSEEQSPHAEQKNEKIVEEIIVVNTLPLEPEEVIPPEQIQLKKVADVEPKIPEKEEEKKEIGEVEVLDKSKRVHKKIMLKQLAHMKQAIRNLQSALKGVQHLRIMQEIDPRIKQKIRASLQNLLPEDERIENNSVIQTNL